MQKQIPFRTLLFTPALHAIMHIEIIRPFQRHRNVQKKDPFRQIAEMGSTDQTAGGPP